MRTLQGCSFAIALLAAGATLGVTRAAGQVPALSDVPVPRPANLGDFVRDERAAEVLGKALFWDMQVGSDDVQACATCHFRAGADPRAKNQVSPGLLRAQIDSVGTVTPPAAERGRQVFFNVNAAPAPRGNCLFCHSGSLFTEATVEELAERGGNMVRNSGGQLSDVGTRNIGVRETADDLGNGDVDPFGAPLSVAARDAPAPSRSPACATWS